MKQEFKIISSLIYENSKILDVGCGNGAFSVQIDQLCNPSSITGIDPSSAQIDYASRREINVPSQFEVGGFNVLAISRR